MPLYLLAAFVASLIPVGAVAIKKASEPRPGELVVTVHPGGYIYPDEGPNTLVLLAVAAGTYWAAKKYKVI